MNKTAIHSVLLFALGMLAAVNALCAERGEGERGQRTPAQLDNRWIEANRMFDQEVTDAGGEVIGRIEDLVISAGGRITYVVLRMSISGSGEQYMPVPWRRIRQADAEGGEYWVVEIDRQRLSQAPSFTSEEWESFGENDWEEIRAYYGEPPQPPRGLRIVQ